MSMNQQQQQQIRRVQPKQQPLIGVMTMLYPLASPHESLEFGCLEGYSPSQYQQQGMHSNQQGHLLEQQLQQQQQQQQGLRDCPPTSMELSQSFLQSIHEDFLAAGGAATRLCSMNYSKTIRGVGEDHLLNIGQQKLDDKGSYQFQQGIRDFAKSSESDFDKHLVEQSRNAMDSLESAIAERDACYEMNMESFMTAWKDLALNKLSVYRNELINLIQESALQKQQYEAVIAYYHERELSRGNPVIADEAISAQMRIMEQELESVKETAKSESVSRVMEELLLKVERDSLMNQVTRKSDQLADSLNQIEEMSFELAQRQCLISDLTVKLSEKSAELLQANSVIAELNSRISVLTEESASAIEKVTKEMSEEIEKSREDVKRIALEKKSESDSKNDTILKLKRILMKERATIKQLEEESKKQAGEIAKYSSDQFTVGAVLPNQHSGRGVSEESKVKEASNNMLEAVQQQPSCQQNSSSHLSTTQSKQSSYYLLKNSSQNHRKHKSVDGSEILLSMNQTNNSFLNVKNAAAAPSNTLNAQIPLGAALNNNSSLLEQSQQQQQQQPQEQKQTLIQPKTRSASLTPAMVQRMMREKKEKMKLREDLKTQILTYMKEFQEIHGRPVSSKADQKPVQNLYDEYKRMTDELKDLTEKIRIANEAISTSSVASATSASAAAAASSEDQQNCSSINMNNISSMSCSNNNANNNNNNTSIVQNTSNLNNISMLHNRSISGNYSNVNMSVDQSKLDLDAGTMVVARQPIFKSTNPNITKHLHFNHSSGFAAANSSQSTAAATILLEHNHNATTSNNNNNTILHHVSSLDQTKAVVDSSIADGLRLQIKSLTQANELLRESMINSINLAQHQKELGVRDARIGELNEIISELSRKVEQKSQAILESTQSIEEQSQMISELQHSLEVLSEKLSLEMKERRVLHNQVEDMKGKIRVFCRVRPASEQEISTNTESAVTIQDSMTVALQSMRHAQNHHLGGVKKYTFDACLGAAATQEDIFQETKRLVQSAVDGYNVCIFTYGQTGSGKTYTMHGTNEQPGITPRSVSELFNLIKPITKQTSSRVTISTCIVELYMDTLIDLLGSASASTASNAKEQQQNNKKLEIKEDPVKNATYIANATVVKVSAREQLDALIRMAMSNRKVSGTDMNSESSRSHFIIQIMVDIYNPNSDSTTHGKINLIDLAGSERILKSNANPLQCKEAQAINLSLTALGDVVSALTTTTASTNALTSTAGQHAAKFIPYRNNKLTYLMKDSLGGNSKTLMIVNLSPSEYNAEESLSSLTYASRVKLITNESSKTVETREFARVKDKLNQCLAENERLTAQLLLRQSLSSNEPAALMSSRQSTPPPTVKLPPGSSANATNNVQETPLKSVLSSLTNIIPANVMFSAASQSHQSASHSQQSQQLPGLQLPVTGSIGSVSGGTSSSASVSPSKILMMRNSANYQKVAAGQAMASTFANSSGSNANSGMNNAVRSTTVDKTSRNINNFITHRASASVSKQLTGLSSNQQQSHASRSMDYSSR